MTLSNLKKNSYVPYSNESEVAVVESKNGNWYPGVRIENISFPLTISAIQNALFCCLSEAEDPTTVLIENPSKQKENLQYWQKQYGFKIADIRECNDIKMASVVRPVDDIPATLQRLLDDALADESDFPVAALVEADAGFIPGVNIETPDWSRGLCAERIALAKAITYGVTDFKSLHISTRDGEYSSPCGACRQVMMEHLPHHPVHLYHADGSQSRHYTSDLLPYSFQSSSLQNKSK